MSRFVVSALMLLLAGGTATTSSAGTITFDSSPGATPKTIVEDGVTATFTATTQYVVYPAAAAFLQTLTGAVLLDLGDPNIDVVDVLSLIHI